MPARKQPRPIPQPYKTHKLPVGQGHTLHIEERGNPGGIPVVVLHGGPGGSISDSSHRHHPVNSYRLIQFDQRGCGKSASQNSPLHANTTSHLIADIEKIRTRLDIEKWVVSGASWGATLALAYAEAHPARVSGLLLSNIFLGTRNEIEWIAKPGGLSRFFPQEHTALSALVPAGPGSLAKRALTILTGADKKHAKNLAFAWSRLEFLAVTTTPNRAEVNKFLKAEKNLLVAAQIQIHYEANLCFLKPNQLLANIAKIKHIPTHIIHGELDMVCPPESAIKLHAAIPKSKLVMLPLVGHHGHPALDKSRRAAATQLAKTLKRKN